ncbi:hypothetical protein [Bacillus sp. ISL-39]|uniref:hypothetical protein n=1 Tax=Bacillus sp. ISL-39 TaxID=2819124 RepID=UPI001BED065C|nr:hypothetical protein [Bacillus sp. ISL-39]MBT2637014.1 hypothetical protein [Bacillus sp. ISL-39]
MKLKEIITKVKENSDSIVGEGINIGSELLLEGVAGQIAPGLVSARASYKQRKSEERIQLALQIMGGRLDEINAIVSRLTPTENKFVDDVVFPFVLENVSDEPEASKIQYLVNLFESIIEHRITDQELIISYYDVLKSLRFMDIRRLIEQTPEYRERIVSNEVQLNVDLSAEGEKKRAFLKFIDNKLEQLGLIQTITFEDVPPDGPITKFGEDFIKFIKAQV